MSEEATVDEVCHTCRDPKMTREFCAAIEQASPLDKRTGECNRITMLADKEHISDEGWLGKLIIHYSEDAVTTGIKYITTKYGRTELAAQPQEQQKTPPEESVKEIEGEKKEEKKPVKTFKLVGKSDIKDLCSGCVGPALLGAGITILHWLTGKQKEAMHKLCNELEAGTTSVEDFVKDTFVMFGLDGLKMWNRIFDDINIAFVVAQQKAIEERPDLKEIPEEEWGDIAPKSEEEGEKAEGEKVEEKKVEEKKEIDVETPPHRKRTTEKTQPPLTDKTNPATGETTPQSKRKTPKGTVKGKGK